MLLLFSPEASAFDWTMHGAVKNETAYFISGDKYNNNVSEVAEKKPISNIATVGVYYWKKGSDYVKYTEQMIEKTVKCTLTTLGFDLSNPIQAQEDMHFLRRLRNLTQKAGTKVIMVLISIATISIAGSGVVALGKAIKQILTS